MDSRREKTSRTRYELDDLEYIAHVDVKLMEFFAVYVFPVI
jgi:hypothetical protein